MGINNALNTIRDGQRTLLMIEDNPDDVELVKTAFNECQTALNFLVAEDGQKAFAMLRQEGDYADTPSPDLIVLDLNLPGMNGMEILNHIKTDDALSKIPVIMFTGSSAQLDIDKCYELHANCYVVKPLTFDDTIAFVNLIESFWFSIVALPTKS